MKPFTLKEYLENPTRNVITRDGRPVRILCTNGKVFSPGPDNTNYPVVALVTVKKSSSSRCKNPHEEILACYNTNGKLTSRAADRNDLFFETTKVSGWANVYSKPSGDVTTGKVYKTREEALNALKDNNCAVTVLFNYLDTVFIEWEE